MNPINKIGAQVSQFPQRWTHKGFSLLELTIVLFIMGLLLQVSIEPLATRLESQRRTQSVEQLQMVQQHLRAHWVSHGHLPCPIVSARPISNNAASRSCQNAVGGLPANELTIVGSVNKWGELLDPWGRSLRYHVSLTDVNHDQNPNTPDWLTAGEISTVSFTELTADLSVCRAALDASCNESHQVASDIVAVVISTGSKDTEKEQDNRDNDNFYISAPFSTADAFRFDDQVIWLGRSELIYFALTSGWLP